jgi:hypothetical protein
MIQAEDGAKVYLAGNALTERKFDLRLIGAGRQEALLDQHERTQAEIDAYNVEAIRLGQKVLGGFSRFELAAAVEAEKDSDE